MNYILCKRITPGDKWSIAIPVAIDLLVLGIFKYLDFFLSMIGVVVEHGVLMSFYRTIIDELNSIGFSMQYPTTVLPIGISFYIFSMISYLGDVYMGRVFQRAAVLADVSPAADGPDRSLRAGSG